VIGGKVLDASALAALARRRSAALAWFDTARLVGIALYLPTLALAEVRAVLPDAAPLDKGDSPAQAPSLPSAVIGDGPGAPQEATGRPPGCDTCMAHLEGAPCDYQMRAALGESGGAAQQVALARHRHTGADLTRGLICLSGARMTDS